MSPTVGSIDARWLSPPAASERLSFNWTIYRGQFWENAAAALDAAKWAPSNGPRSRRASSATCLARLPQPSMLRSRIETCS
jgi:hypothetical protein